MGVFVWRKGGSRKGSKTSRKQSKQSKANKARQGSKEAKGREQKGRNRAEGRTGGRTGGRTEHEGRFASLATRTDGNHLLNREGRKVILYSGRAEKGGRKNGRKTDGKEGSKGSKQRKEAKGGRKGGS